MNPVLNELERDPLFQVNVVLWMAQPLPFGIEGQPQPLLHSRGFTVYAVGPLLALPPEVRLALVEAGVDAQESAAPDVVLARQTDSRFAFVECKGGSFGVESSTAKQARALLIMAGPAAADVLGLQAESVSEAMLSLISSEEDRGKLKETLGELGRELSEARFRVGPSDVLGIRTDGSRVSIEVHGAASRFYGLASGSHELLKLEPETDPRPLYFIPFDPDVNQSPAERAYCKRVLYERMHVSIVSAVGHAGPPVDLTIETERLLNDAMFGAYSRWEKRESRQNLKRLCRQFMAGVEKALNSEYPGTVIFEPGVGWKIRLQDRIQLDDTLAALEHFSCETLDLEAEPEQLSLEDEAADKQD
jgi:hypothetical protein